MPTEKWDSVIDLYSQDLGIFLDESLLRTFFFFYSFVNFAFVSQKQPTIGSSLPMHSCFKTKQNKNPSQVFYLKVLTFQF